MSQIKKIAMFLVCALLQGCSFWRDTPPPLADNSLAHYYAVRLPQDLREAYGDSWREVQKAIEAFWKRVQDCILRHDAAAFADLIEYPINLNLSDEKCLTPLNSYCSCVIRSKSEMRRLFPFIFHPIRKNFTQASDWRYYVWEDRIVQLHWWDAILNAEVTKLHLRSGHHYGGTSQPLRIRGAITLTGAWPRRILHETLRARSCGS